MLRKLFGGMGLILALCLSLSTNAFAYGSYGPQPAPDADNEKYYYWGSTEEPQYSPNGVNISVDGSSVSYQSIKATLTMDPDLIAERNISYFAILANGVYVDFVMPYFDNALDIPRYREYYALDIDITDSFIGSEIYFQVLGVSVTGGDHYVVAWSSQSANYTFKPLPVIDRSAIAVLEAILLKLQDILNMLQDLKNTLAAKLDQLTKAVEDIYTPSPAAEQQLHDAIDNLMEKLPTTEMTEKVNEMNDALEQSRSQLMNPEGAELKLGGKFRLIPELAESEVSFLDLTEYRDQVLLFRTVLEAMIWVYFFHMILNRFTPRASI